MTTRAVVRGIGHYLPERVVPNAWFEERIDTSDEWIRTRSGIERRHFAAEGETTSMMAIEAAKAALDDAGILESPHAALCGGNRQSCFVGNCFEPLPGVFLQHSQDDQI